MHASRPTLLEVAQVIHRHLWVESSALEVGWSLAQLPLGFRIWSSELLAPATPTRHAQYILPLRSRAFNADCGRSSLAFAFQTWLQGRMGSSMRNSAWRAV